MEKVILEIECPHCHKRVKIEYKDGIEDATLSCAHCTKASPFRSYAIAEGTQYIPITPVIGQLLVKSTGKRYDLKEGEFTVGRAATKKVADIMLDVTDMTMSRIHMKIKVMKSSHNYLHRITTAENKHPIFVNAKELNEKDIFMLKYGDSIKMGSTYVQFVKPDEGEI